MIACMDEKSQEYKDIRINLTNVIPNPPAGGEESGVVLICLTMIWYLEIVIWDLIFYKGYFLLSGGNNNKNLDRREFLKGFFRTGTAIGLVSVTGMLLKRRKDVTEQEMICTNYNFCQKCRRYSICSLPERIEKIQDQRSQD